MRQFRVPRTILLTLPALAAAFSCGSPSTPGPAVRLLAGKSDTVVVNHSVTTLLPVNALDAVDRTVAGAPIQFERIRGASIPITAAGSVTCTRPGDVVVRATLGRLSTALLIRCRPVEYLQIPGPIQFVLGDSALTHPMLLPIAAHDKNGRPVEMLAGSVTVLDSAVASVRGSTIRPRARGTTIASARVGNRSASIGVHIYQRFDSIEAPDTLLRVRPKQRLFALPLRLQPGEFRRQRVPPGDWMITTLTPTDTNPNAMKLHFENASCVPNLLNESGRFGCRTGTGAAVVVYRPFSAGDTATATGYLLLRWLFGVDPLP